MLKQLRQAVEYHLKHVAPTSLAKDLGLSPQDFRLLREGGDGGAIPYALVERVHALLFGNDTWHIQRAADARISTTVDKAVAARELRSGIFEFRIGVNAQEALRDTSLGCMVYLLSGGPLKVTATRHEVELYVGDVLRVREGSTILQNAGLDTVRAIIVFGAK